MKSLLAAALAALAIPVAASAEELRVATFNTEFLIRTKVHAREGLLLTLNAAQQAVWTPQHREQAFQNAVMLVAPVVASLQADVVVLTEIGPLADVNTLNAALPSPYPHVAVCQCTDSATEQNVAILSRIPFTAVRQTIPGREHFLAELDDPETEDDTGISKGLSVTLTFSGEQIALYGIHLVSERGGHEEDAQRIAQASIVRRNYLRDLAAGRHDIEPDLMQTGLAEFFDQNALGERWTYEFEGERNQIDHILLSDSFRDVAKRGGIDASVMRVTNPAVSDHSPLVVTIDFRE